MAGSAASETLVVASHRGPYSAEFVDDPFPSLARDLAGPSHLIADARVAELYAGELRGIQAAPALLLDATEEAKSLEAMPRAVEALVRRGVRRGDVLVALGGGIVQDVVCFIAATLLRGLKWRLYPTTLLAQADSCIGSKSSINAAGAKNILGTFTPPAGIVVSTRFLRTLDERDVRSGVGEMLKVHAIDGPESFDAIARDYAALFSDDGVMRRYLRRSLEIKKRIVELDEFDRGPRNVMNYGHTFGHALEAATGYAVPHGIAVTIGMDMANFVAAGLGRAPRSVFSRMHPTLKLNYAGYERAAVPLKPFFASIAKDKKNTADRLGLILPTPEGRVERCLVPNDEAFHGACSDYLRSARAS